MIVKKRLYAETNYVIHCKLKYLKGMQFGTVISLPLSGYLCEIQWDNGWPLAFYVPGSLAVVWFIFWVMLIFDGPDVHPRIAEDEKKYILDSTGRREGREGQAQHKVRDSRSIMWIFYG